MKKKAQRGAVKVETAILVALMALVALPAVENAGIWVKGAFCPVVRIFISADNVNSLKDSFKQASGSNSYYCFRNANLPVEAPRYYYY